ncbi:uncharacterized protein LOC112351435 isoform X2 [Selaginella moellendorffii]|uniref:uncharacterized protein LOC112351435 isoform X2 n=1 Tax=Selaginella moellendorffii TaxID=88036 RepID=UPI000D1C50E0|nr:uncharacterized protein LOC112351435 isoform X2 [Selaginella moellendorffii]|eukprot:XP_024545112.1 uncharacterized protein LOC112351435 isoform X2 [Selaginella moellendorffii]
MHPVEHPRKPGAPREKHCRAETPADDGWISQCSGKISCPSTCPRCHLSCKFCGMIYCPRCNKIGSVCQDPRFIGGDGVTFYFHGEKDKNFCLVSDSSFHLNAHLIGKRPPGRSRDFTWIQALGILFGPHKLYVGARRVATWDGAKDHFLVHFDSNAVSIEQGTGAVWEAESGPVKLTRLEATNSLSVFIPGALNASVAIVPISKEESRVHGYEISGDDCFAHLEVNFQFAGLGSRVEGLLGQTYAADWRSPIKEEGIAMPTLGARADRYEASSILTPDCSVSQFHRAL